MLSRNEKGSLVLKTLDLSILVGDLFEQCKDEREVEWLKEQIQSCAECVSEDRLNEL